MNEFSTSRLIFITPIWLALSLGGFVYWERLDRIPGPVGDHSSMNLGTEDIFTNGPSVVLFLHPHCPCARVTLNQLSCSLESQRYVGRVFVVFVVPPGVNQNWEQGELWLHAKMIPGIRVISDIDGKIANGAGVHTSGHLIITDSANSIRFTGGITRGRGSEEDCAGMQAMVSLLSGKSTKYMTTPVFGCPLFESNCRDDEGDSTCP